MVDWDALRAAALAAATRAYAPYSGFHVGAAGITEDGVVVVGSNVENASYGLTICAEVSLVADLRRLGGARLVAVSAMANGDVVTPCGRCRQVLLEHGGPQCLVDGRPRPRSLAELLPDAFDGTELRRSP
jgi:cytidine deaminase